MSVSLNSSWEAEAQALIDDTRQHVRSIKVSGERESSNKRIYLDVVTLEGDKLIVCMDSSGFRVCAAYCNQPDESQPPESDAIGPVSETTTTSGTSERVYETINALLDANSPMYRGSFARALMEKINETMASS